MKKRVHSNEALLSIAVAGLLSGAIGSSCSVEKSEAPAAAAHADANPAALGLAKHACKGFNACKAQGGCKTKNSCKGKGGCEVPVMR